MVNSIGLDYSQSISVIGIDNLIIHQNLPFHAQSIHETFAVVHIRITSARYNNHYNHLIEAIIL